MPTVNPPVPFFAKISKIFFNTIYVFAHHFAELPENFIISAVFAKPCVAYRMMASLLPYHVRWLFCGEFI